MYKVGLTGGIGSGKSTVAQVFEMLGIPVFYSDFRAKELMLREDIARQVIAEFGSESYTSDGQLAREVIARAAFSNPEKLQKLNSIVHPALGREFLVWAEQQVSPYVIEEAAILIESGAYLQMDQIVVVDAPLETRIQRVINRDGHSRESVEARIAAQIPTSELITYANFTITANDKLPLLPQIVAIDSEIRKKVVYLHSK